MSYTLFVEGKITETTGGAHNVFSNKIIAFNANGVITQTGEENGISFGEPKNAPPFEINNIYVKVRLKETYNGEFGFDWVDVHPDTKDIQKIQDVDFDKVEYFYKEGTTKTDLGNIIEKKGNETSAKTAIEKNYTFNNMCKHIDLPYVLIKPGQEIILSAEIIACDGTFNQDEITITGDKFFKFEILEGEKEGETAKIKIAKAGKIDFKITCLEEAPEEKEYNFFHSSATNPALPVGGIVLMENKTLKLKFRVIALVSSDNDPNAKAQALFKKFKEAGVKDYLNKNSLNQAGYEVEIENFDAMDAADVDDYLYAFDKTDWTNKKYFANINKQKPDVDPTTGYCKTASWDPVKEECAKIPVPTDVIVDNQKDLGLPDKANEMDGIAITGYKNKLKTKSKAYEGGIIILSDFESFDENTGAYSRTSPLNHYVLMVYSTNTGNTDTYAHEIGHMLGLPHLFFDAKEKKSYKTARENILGNSEPEKNLDGTKNKKYNPGIKKHIQNVRSSSFDYYGWTGLTAIKKDMISKMKSHNENRLKNIQEMQTTVAKYKSFPDSYEINITGGGKMSKKEYVSKLNASIKKGKEDINENITAISVLEKKTNNYETLVIPSNYKKSDMIILLEQNRRYYEIVIEQVHSNYIMFMQGKTKNMMDYHNTRVVYLANQIKVMRSDMQNYVDIVPVAVSKPKPKSK